MKGFEQKLGSVRAQLREKARARVRSWRARTDAVIDAYQAAARKQLTTAQGLADGLFEDDAHTLGDCAKDVLAATVTSWLDGCELMHTVCKTCLGKDEASQVESSG